MKMNKLTKTLLSAAVAAACCISAANELPAGTEVILRFDQYLSSRTAKPGEVVRLEVAEPVIVNGETLIPAGRSVRGVLTKVSQNQHFGVNARMRIALDPIWIHHHEVTLEPRDKGKVIGGTRSDMAGAASGGGLIVLGPLGLAAGYFVVGHSVHVRPGDHLRTVVNQSVPMG